MKKIFFIILSFFIALPALADFSVTDWKYYKPIEVTRTGLQKLQLDKESFSGVQKDLRDLRIVAPGGEEVPYKMVVEAAESGKYYFSETILNNAYTQGQYQQFIIDLGPRDKNVPHNFVEIKTPETNFQKQVEVSGSDDLSSSWQTLLSGGYIYDYSDTRGNLKAQDTTVEYPLSTFQYIRVRIFSASSFRVSGARIYKFVETVAKETTFDVDFTQRDDAKEGYTYLTLDLGQSGLPTRELILFSSDTNFDRPLSLSAFGSDPSQTPQEAVSLGSGYIFRYSTNAFKGENLTIPYRETSSRYIVASIFNGDDKPIRFTGAQVKGILRSVVFESKPNTSYRLYYGNSKARRPIYDIERRFPYIDLSSASIAMLGPQEMNASFVKILPPVSERYAFLFPAILILAALFLLFLVYRFVRKVK